MATKKQAVEVTGNRQASYTARNRAKLIKEGQEVEVEIGPVTNYFPVQCLLMPKKFYV